MKENVIEEKSFNFAIKVVHMYKYLTTERNEFVISKQLLRSGTSIGANVAEAQSAQSRADFGSKMSIASKEAFESAYWLKLLSATDYITENQFDELSNDINEIKTMLVSIVKTTLDNQNN